MNDKKKLVVQCLQGVVEVLEKVFCPTGPGGGINPGCGAGGKPPSGGGGGASGGGGGKPESSGVDMNKMKRVNPIKASEKLRSIGIKANYQPGRSSSGASTDESIGDVSKKFEKAGWKKNNDDGLNDSWISSKIMRYDKGKESARVRPTDYAGKPGSEIQMFEM